VFFGNGIVPKRNGAWECGVTKGSREFGYRTSFRGDYGWLRATLLCIALLFLMVTAGSRSARAEAVQNSDAASAGPGLSIAIADFDGDQRPDLASVEIGHSGSATNTYWIQFQLSAAGRQSVQLVAPAGGLRIEARDVNGDHNVDLIFTTAWYRQPVAILLNDGHGRFSRAEPAAFPGAFGGARTEWISGRRLGAELAGLPPQSRTGVDEAEKDPSRPPALAGKVPSARPAFSADPFIFFASGRAPPPAVSSL